jgi:hypothetical protein
MRLRKRKRSRLMVEVFDRHIDHALDPNEPLCGHSDAWIGVGDTLTLDTGLGFGAGFELRLEGPERLVVVVNHAEYVLAKETLARQRTIGGSDGLVDAGR